MIRSDILFLSQYIIGGRLTTRELARRIWAEESLQDKRCIRIDFSHIEAKDLTREFIAELFRLGHTDPGGVWLSPINYSGEVAPLLSGCFSKLKKLRASSIHDGLVKAELHFAGSYEHSS